MRSRRWVQKEGEFDRAWYLRRGLVLGAMALVLLGGTMGSMAEELKNDHSPVKITETPTAVTLENGVVALTVQKTNGNITSLVYQDLDFVKHGEGYWNVYGSTPTTGTPMKTQSKGQPSVVTVTQDPAANGGAMGEFELLFPYQGNAKFEPLDIAIRYSLKRGDSGVYGWTSVTHRAGYPAFDVEASTVCLKLDPSIFDHLTVDRRRNLQMITGTDWMQGEHLNLKEARRMTTGVKQGQVEHKYDYAAMFSETPAYGWSSTSQKVGIWLVNPSLEYLSGPPTRIELTGHLDLKDTPQANPILLLSWHSFHYGGLPLWIAQDEAWNKVVGPFLIYCNRGPTPNAMWADAQARAKVEQAAWPYAWAKASGFANAEERGEVQGKLVATDPQQPTATAARAWVGLAAAPYVGTDQQMRPFNVSWETDGKHYEYWAQADATGAFTIKNARPGTYVLYAFNNGILGEFSKAEVTVVPGKTLDLGTLPWTPIRYGQQLWEIGIPDRSAAEFRHGDHYWQWGLYNLYPTEFPHDVNFEIGKSDWKTDWNYVQPPRLGADNRWSGTTWKVLFNVPQSVKGRGTLRLALCGTRNTKIDVAVNGHYFGTTGLLPSSGVMHRDGIRAVEIECDLPFDASLLVPGQNLIELTTRATLWTDGVLYDYLRLELDQHAPPPPPAAPSDSGPPISLLPLPS